MIHARHLLLPLLGVMLLGGPANAFQPADYKTEKWTPLQLSLLWPDYQLFHDTYNVCGLRLGLVTTENRNLYGLDIGLINECETFAGVQLCGYSAKTQDARGLQLALGFIRVDDYDAWGVQLAGLGGCVRDFHGIQITGVQNYNRTVSGLTFALWETEVDAVSGFQIGGVFATADGVDGFQFAVGHAQLRQHPLHGLQLAGLWADAPQLRGVQFALFCGRVRSETFRGLQIAGLAAFDVPAHPVPEGPNPADEKVVPETDGRGLQMAAVVCENFTLNGLMLTLGWNDARNSINGMQFALALNHTREMNGVQLALFNLADTLAGCQAGAVNLGGTESGCQLGLVNVADHHDGVQAGLVNYSRELTGVQLGLVNIGRNCRFPCLPLLNARF
ncbi:MAG: hypothetical protein WC708_07325 [Lentisphaeria bacterium]